MPAATLGYFAFQRSFAYALIACVFFAQLAVAQSAVSRFETDDDGWRLIGDSTTSIPTWIGSGGNTGGFVRGLDQTVGGVWYWLAPSRFLGDASGAYTQTLSFDLRMRGNGTIFDNSDIILTSGATALHIDLSPVPADTTWTSYSALIDASAGWKVGSLSGPLAGESEIRTVLANLTSLQIRGEFITGDDNGDLDNVVFNGVPGPSTGMLAAVSSIAFMRRRRQAA